MARKTAGFRLTDDSKSERLGLGSFDVSTNDSYYCNKFRCAFIQTVDNLEQDVANSLYKEAFFKFVLLAWSHYPEAIPPSGVALKRKHSMRCRSRNSFLKLFETNLRAAPNAAHAGQ